MTTIWERPAEGYNGVALTERVIVTLNALQRNGFTVATASGGNSSGKTLNVFGPNGEEVAYVNKTIIVERGASIGYRFTESFAPGVPPKNSMPNEERDVKGAFCARYGCSIDDLDVHEGTRGNLYLALVTPDTAVRVLLQDAGRSDDADGLVISKGKDGVWREGSTRHVETTAKERNPAAVRACLEAYGYSCYCCDENLKEKYKGLLFEVIHVHHLDPLCNAETERDVTVADLRPVCPNCHSVMHRKHRKAGMEPYTPNEVRAMLGLEQRFD